MSASNSSLETVCSSSALQRIEGKCSTTCKVSLVKSFKLFLLLGTLSLCSSCLLLLLPFIFGSGTTREVVDFNTDPRILRGVWVARVTTSGEITTRSVTLNLVAGYVDETTYTITGSATSEGTTYTVTGYAWGGGTSKYVNPQTSLPRSEGATLQLRDASNTSVFQMELFYFKPLEDRAMRYEGTLHATNSETSGRFLELTRAP
jgi:hypothetical protein